MKIAIMGNKDTVAGFRAIGVHTFAVDTIESARKNLEQIKTQGDYGILFITENWISHIQKDIDEILGSEALPAILAVPAAKGPSGEGLNNIKRIVEKAVGSDILS